MEDVTGPSVAQSCDDRRETERSTMTVPDPHAVLRSPGYVRLLVLAAVIGAPVAAAAYGFLWLVDELQEWLYTDLPRDMGFDREPMWWPLPLLVLAGVLVGLTIRYLPGKGGESPADGFQPGRGAPTPIELPSIFLAALAGLSLGVVIGPEAPLIALGGGLGVCAVRLAARDAPPRTEVVIAAAGSFSAISTLLGSPLLGAFLLMEGSGLAGATMGLVLVPGLVAAGVGSLIFVGLDSWTGLGTFSLVIPDLPAAGTPTIAGFGWAIGIGLAAAVLGAVIRRLALLVRPHVEPRTVLLTPVVGLAIAGLAIAFAEASDKSSSLVLFSGQSALGPLLDNAATYSVGTLLLLIVCKGLAYSLALSAFRGGPIFPAMFLGAVGGVALSHLPGLGMVSGAAIGMGAMTVAMLRLPMTSLLLATLLLASSGLEAMPLVIVAVAVSYVASEWLTPSPAAAPPSVPAPPAAARPVGVPDTP
jgi:H+/Cl- antiporter ClcA